MTTPQYPPAWQPSTGPPQPQYPPPPQRGGATPGGYPPAAYPPPPYPGGGAPGGYPPAAYPPPPYPGGGAPGGYPPAAYPPNPGYPQPGQPYPGGTYPPAPPQQPGYQPEPPTTVLGPPSSYPPPSYPPAGPDPAGPDPSAPSGPPKKSIGAKISGVVVSLVVVALVVVALVLAFKFGRAAFLSSIFDRSSAPANPFEGTAAESYPIGEAGIVVPAATAVDGFTEDEVAAALETVRQALVAGRLDERMLYDHDRSTLRALFSRLGAEDLDLMFEEKLGGIVATMIAPGYTLTADPIRVSGTMTFTGTVMEDIRWLEVHTVFVWVYPFTGELKTPGDHLVTLKDDIYWLFPAAEDVLPEDTGMYLDGRSSSFAYNIDCDLLKQDLLALGKPQFSVGGEEIDPNDVMDPNSPVNLPDTC